MQQWRRRIRGVLGMGLAWAIGGVGVAGVLELVDNVLPAAHPVTRLVDMWPQLLAILGFLAGIVFALTLGIAARRRRLQAFTYARFAALGALSGALLGALALATGAPLAILGLATLASALGGVGSLFVARVAERRGLLGAGGTDPDGAGLLGRAD